MSDKKQKTKATECKDILERVAKEELEDIILIKGYPNGRLVVEATSIPRAAVLGLMEMAKALLTAPLVVPQQTVPKTPSIIKP